MAEGFFITGTDTGIGKTQATIALMEEFKKQGYKVAGMKPVASGAEIKNGGPRNEDAELIQESCSESVDYGLINPFVFELPVSPHIAAEEEERNISLDEIENCYNQLAFNNDLIFVEGVGGWRVPISDDLSMVDLAKKIHLPVILVVGLKLGCLNHAVLTAEAIKNDGLNLLGWISNGVEEGYQFLDKSIETLKKTIDVTYLGHIPFNHDPNSKCEFQFLNMSLNSNSL